MPTHSDVEELVPDPQVAQELGVSLMTLWRWDRDSEMAALGWPALCDRKSSSFVQRPTFNQLQPRPWFAGMLLRTTPHHVAYNMLPQIDHWTPEMPVQMKLDCGQILTLSKKTTCPGKFNICHLGQTIGEAR